MSEREREREALRLQLSQISGEPLSSSSSVIQLSRLGFYARLYARLGRLIKTLSVPHLGPPVPQSQVKRRSSVSEGQACISPASLSLSLPSVLCSRHLESFSALFFSGCNTNSSLAALAALQQPPAVFRFTVHCSLLRLRP